MDQARATVRVDSRAPHVVGRTARLELSFAARAGRTVLAHAYAEPPFHVGRLVENGGDAQVVLVCCGPGVFAGDRLEQRILVGGGARVALVSQAALQVHPSAAADPARLDSSFVVDAGGFLDCFLDPLIPFVGARLRQRIELRIADGGDLFWGDALMSGRAGRGEAWRFDTIDHELRLHVEGRLQYLERYRLSPESRDVRHPWIAGAADYCGTALVCSDVATPARAEAAQQELSGIVGVRAGVDCLTDRVVVSRILATRGPQFVAARAMLRHIFLRPPLRRP